MQRFTAALCTTGGLIYLTACSAPDSTGPANRPILTTTAAAALTCDLTDLKKAARAYFTSSRDPIFAIISDLGTSYKNGPSAATTDYVLDGWARLAEARLTSAQKSGTTGVEANAVARGLAGCAEPSFVAELGDIDFTSALNPGGLFEVRGDDAQDPPTTPAYSRGGTNVWATHPVPNETWESSFGRRVAIYGYLTSLTSVDDVVVAEAFEFNTAPHISTLLPMVRGICGYAGSTFRIQRNQSLIPDAELDCGGASFTSLSRSGGPLLALARQVASIFVPQSLEAAATGTAGSIHDYSPHLAVDLKFVTMSFVSQPLDGYVDQPIPGSGTSGVVEVLVQTAGGRGLPNVVVTMAVAGNMGSTVTIAGNTATTDANGLASFPNLTVNKAGGYTFSTAGTYDGIPATDGVSALANIKNR